MAERICKTWVEVLIKGATCRPASLFRFRFSAGVALGGSRASPGIALGVPVANLPLVPVGPDAPRLCDVSLEDVDNLASLSSKPVEAGLVTDSFPTTSA